MILRHAMIYRLLLGLAFLLSLNNVGAQSTPNVVVSIKPIHSIVTALMEGVSRPQLLLESSDSAHTFHLKPSQLNLLSNADLVITIGDGFETGLKKTLRNIKIGSHIIVSEIFIFIILEIQIQMKWTKVEKMNILIMIYISG